MLAKRSVIWSIFRSLFGIPSQLTLTKGPGQQPKYARSLTITKTYILRAHYSNYLGERQRFGRAVLENNGKKERGSILFVGNVYPLARGLLLLSSCSTVQIA
jgi:hypothetical protein